MDVDPLWRDAERPEVDVDGIVVNSFATGPTIDLVDEVPVPVHQLGRCQAYRSWGLEYFTDDHGLPARVRGRLRLVEEADRVRHPGSQRAAGVVDGVDGFDGGHIVAVSLGGFASGPNLTPQVANMNRSAYKRLENGWRSALTDGCPVEVDIALTVNDDPVEVAVEIIVTWWEDGERYELVMLNEHDAQ